MIKAVLFDYGGVLNESGRSGNIQRVLGQIFGINPEDIQIDDLHQKFIRGLIGEDEFFGGINKRYGQQTLVNKQVFEDTNLGFFDRCLPVYELAEKLRAAGIKTGILSNIYGITAHELKERGNYDGFDPVVLSFEEHVAKPDLVFFETALKKLDLPANQVLFVDDQERFRSVVESLGMQFVVAASPDQLVRDVKAFLLKENDLQLD